MLQVRLRETRQPLTNRGRMVEPTGIEPATFSLRTRGANQGNRRFTVWFRKIPPPKETGEDLTVRVLLYGQNR